METIITIQNPALRREIEHRLAVASYEVAPEMNDSDRVIFMDEMLEALSPDDVAAILGLQPLTTS